MNFEFEYGWQRFQGNNDVSRGSQDSNKRQRKWSGQLGLGGPAASKLTYFNQQLRVSAKRSLVIEGSNGAMFLRRPSS